jgi:hypothetical protein
MKAPTKIFGDADGDAESGSAEVQGHPLNVGPVDAERQCCVDCGLEAPATQTAYTLISPAHRWRLRKVADASGRQVIEWRCAKCWARYRAKIAPST